MPPLVSLDTAVVTTEYRSKLMRTRVFGLIADGRNASSRQIETVFRYKDEDGLETPPEVFGWDFREVADTIHFDWSTLSALEKQVDRCLRPARLRYEETKLQLVDAIAVTCGKSRGRWEVAGFILASNSLTSCRRSTECASAVSSLSLNEAATPAVAITSVGKSRSDAERNREIGVERDEASKTLTLSVWSDFAVSYLRKSAANRSREGRCP